MKLDTKIMEILCWFPPQSHTATGGKNAKNPKEIFSKKK